MPQIYLENIKINCNAEIYFWHIAENCDELSELVADNGVSLAEVKNRFKSLFRQREWLATRALLKQTPHEGKEILYHKNGQPYLADRYISISHTKDYIALAVSEYPIGIDIEKRERNAQSVIKAILQPQESGVKAGEVLNIWVAKESAFKMAPEKATVLKDILTVKKGEGYSITYPDGSTAKCNIFNSGEIILAICTEKE